MGAPSTADLRRERLVIYCGIAQNRREWIKGMCCWCGEPIVLADPDREHRRRSRTRHRGDEHELGDGRDCHQLFLGSYAYTARQLVEQRGDPCCVYCGEVTEQWEADHQVPLEDGGGHDPTNIVRSCVPCHRAKTAAEATEHAARRRRERGVPDQLPAVNPHQIELSA